MPRAIRIFGNGITYHVVSKCNAREFLFKTSDDFVAFLKHLENCKKEFLFDIHAYCLMQSHIHLILTTKQDMFLNKVMYEICQRFSYHYNRQNNREGHFWKNRYFSKIINNDVYGLVCLRYLHRNPLRAGIVGHPSEWPWSCVQMYLQEEFKNILTPLASYLGLASDEAIRRKIYKNWLETTLLSEKRGQELVEGKIQPGSRRFQRVLKNEIAPTLQRTKNGYILD